jgi:hypothetical protein
VGVFEVSNVFSDLFHLFPFGPRYNIICTGSLRKGKWDVWLKYMFWQGWTGKGHLKNGCNIVYYVQQVMSVCYGAKFVFHVLSAEHFFILSDAGLRLSSEVSSFLSFLL